MTAASTPVPRGASGGTRQNVRAARPLGIGLAAAWIAGALLAGLCAPEKLGVLCSDDSFYYFLTARHVVLGQGVTFDGINPTNGFHPLWMVLVAPLYAVTGGDYDLSLRLVFMVLLGLFLGSMGLTFRLLREWAGRIPAMLTLPLFLHPAVFNLFFNGLESALVIFLLLLLLTAARRKDLVSPGMGRRNQVLAGLLLGLVFLSRLDCAFHLMGLGVAALVVYRLPLWRVRALPSLLRSYGLLLSVFLLVVAPYFAWNLAANGRLSPISGALKSSFPDPDPQIRTLVSVWGAPYALFILVSLIIAAVQWLKADSPLRRIVARRGAGDPWSVLLCGLWLGCLLHYGYTLLFTTWGAHQWHFASYVPIALLCAGWMMAWLTAARRWLVAGLALLVPAASGAMLVLSLLQKADQHAHWHDAAIWARNHTPPDSVFGMTDAGYFAYFSRRNTVNLDGLINGYDFQEALATGNLDAYFRRCKIAYIADYEVPEATGRYHAVKMTHLLRSRKRVGSNGYHWIFPLEEAVYQSAPYAPYGLPFRKPEGRRILFCIWPYAAGRLMPADLAEQAAAWQAPVTSGDRRRWINDG